MLNCLLLLLLTMSHVIYSFFFLQIPLNGMLLHYLSDYHECFNPNALSQCSIKDEKLNNIHITTTIKPLHIRKRVYDF